jgi:ATP/maltotriose-dependent transcriptional regulator MalT
LKQKSKNENLIRILLIIGLLFSLAAFYAIRQKLKRNKLEKEKVDAELAFKKKELTPHALHLAKKNEVLEGLKQKAEELKASENNQNGYQQLIRTINFDLQDDNNWENFSKYFQEVHKDFNSNVKEKFPEVTPNELRLMSLLKMNLSSKEIANILNISPDGIKKARYRLRKKLNINTDNSLQDFVLGL